MLIFTTFRPAMSMGRADLVASGIVVFEDQRAGVRKETNLKLVIF